MARLGRGQRVQPRFAGPIPPVPGNRAGTVPGGVAVFDLDTFEARGNGTLGSPWATFGGKALPTVVGGEVFANADSTVDAAASPTLLSANMASGLTLVSGPAATTNMTFDVYARISALTSGADYYVFRMFGSFWRLLRRTGGGAETVIQQVTRTQTLSNITELRITTVGTTITGYAFISGVWTQVAQVTDANISGAGYAGFGTALASGGANPVGIEEVSWGGTTVATGGGSATLTGTRAQVTSGPITGSGGGASTLTTAKSSSSAVSSTAGGAAALAFTNANFGSLSTTGGGGGTLTALRSATRAATATAGGGSTISAAKTPEPGGVLWTGLMGGGGRVGRSHPAMGRRQPGIVPMNVANAEARSGTVSGTGGGSVRSTTGAKGASALTVEFIGIPPVFVQQRAGVIGHGGGSLVYIYARSAAGVGLVIGTGGGSAALRIARGGRGTLTAAGGGAATLRASRGARGAVTGSAGGAGAFVYALTESRSGTVAGTGGGASQSTRRRSSLSVAAGTGGGSVVARIARQTTRSITTTGGGSATLLVAAAGPAGSGNLIVSGGGTARLTGARGAVAFVSAAGGGTAVLRHVRTSDGHVIGSADGDAALGRAFGAIQFFSPIKGGRIARPRDGKAKLAGVT